MAKIKLLSPQVVKCIAAGEVIEKPASVIKELVENSLDAGATSVKIEVEQGGLALVRVIDDGIGIEKDDLSIALERHASSKVSTVEDIYNINTMGFRGEALYSIAAVSRLKIASKAAGKEDAWEIISEPGKAVEGPRPSALAKGTDITVRDLFFNMPARKKFLKGPRSQYSAIVSLITKYTLIYPDIAWQLYIDKKERLNLPSGQSILDRAQHILSANKDGLIQLDVEINTPENIKITGFVSNAREHKKNRSSQFIFVNKRPVNISALSFRVNDIYKSILSPKTYPVFGINIEISPSLVDVNVHPTKQEVRFKDENRIISIIARAIETAIKGSARPKQAFIAHNKIAKFPQSHGKNNPVYPKPVTADVGLGLSSKAMSVVKEPEEEILVSEKQKVEERPQGLFSMLKGARIIGVAMNKYLLCEYGDSLLVIDVHAAAEKVNYERFLEQVQNSSIESQHLITPQIIKLSIADMEKWKEIKNVLEDCGFSTSLWSENEIAVHSAPGLCKDPASAVYEAIAGAKGLESMESITDKIARSACRRSIMAGDRVSNEEAQRLINDLFKTEDPFACPHGRPAVIEITDSDLEKLFMRKP